MSFTSIILLTLSAVAACAVLLIGAIFVNHMHDTQSNDMFAPSMIGWFVFQVCFGFLVVMGYRLIA